MMKRFLSLLYILTFCLPVLHAQVSQLNSFLNSPRILQNNESMPSLGKYAGTRVENNRRRSIVLLTTEDKKLLNIAPDQLAFANFRHNKEFYIATIKGFNVDAQGNIKSNMSVVSSITYSKKHWAGKIRSELKNFEVHSELTFQLTNPSAIKLIFNQNKNKFENRTLNDSIVLSVEAARPAVNENAGYLPEALGPNFALVYRLISGYERNLQHLEDKDRIITSQKLNFNNTRSKSINTNSKLDAVLITALITSNNKRRSETYNIVDNNCMTGVLTVIDQSVNFNNGAGINRRVLVDELNIALNNESDNLSNYLNSDSVKEMAIRNTSINANLLQNLIQVIENYRLKLKNHEPLMDDRFIRLSSGLPPFIDAHLKARGLI